MYFSTFYKSWKYSQNICRLGYFIHVYIKYPFNFHCFVDSTLSWFQHSYFCPLPFFIRTKIDIFCLFTFGWMNNLWFNGRSKMHRCRFCMYQEFEEKIHSILFEKIKKPLYEAIADLFSTYKNQSTVLYIKSSIFFSVCTRK